MKKILIIGLGSIGQRHLRNLNTIDKKLKFLAFRRKKIVPTLNDNLEANYKLSIEKLYNIKTFKTFENSLNQKPYAAFICTPSSFHVKEAIECLKKNVHVFIEKPLGSNEKNLDILKKLYSKKKNRIIAMVGFQIKFNPLYIYLKKFIKKNHKFINRVQIYNGEHINDFHKYEDYKISYAANKKLGGGVLLTQIHEIDYFMDLFSNYKIKIVSSLLEKRTKLKLDVEDTFHGKFTLKNKLNEISADVWLDYYTKPKKKYIKIFLKKTLVIADFAKKKFILKKKGKIYIKDFEFENNEPFKKEVIHFLKSIKNKKISNRFDLNNGIKSLEMVLRLKKLSKNSF